MVSIIVCSRTLDISPQQRSNIATTVGCDHEIVVIDNSLGRYSIFAAYNEGVRRSQGDILCFVHDDVEFCSAGWGEAIASLFGDESIGLIGFGGAHFMPNSPLYWLGMPYISEFNQNLDNGRLVDCYETTYFHGSLADVAVVDGMCFFVPRRLFSTIRFDEEYYSGFHAYDMDICMQVQQAGYRVCVNREVKIVHRWSEQAAPTKRGMNLFEHNLELFCRKWQPMLPIVRGIELPERTIRNLNNLCALAYDATLARRSASYQLGRTLLAPARWLKRVVRKD